MPRAQKSARERGDWRKHYVGQARRFALGNYLLARSRERAIILQQPRLSALVRAQLNKFPITKRSVSDAPGAFLGGAF